MWWQLKRNETKNTIRNLKKKVVLFLSLSFQTRALFSLMWKTIDALCSPLVSTRQFIFKIEMWNVFERHFKWNNSCLCDHTAIDCTKSSFKIHSFRFCWLGFRLFLFFVPFFLRFLIDDINLWPLPDVGSVQWRESQMDVQKIAKCIKYTVAKRNEANQINGKKENMHTCDRERFYNRIKVKENERCDYAKRIKKSYKLSDEQQDVMKKRIKIEKQLMFWAMLPLWWWLGPKS